MPEKRTYKYWTEEEIEFLKNNVGNKSFPAIAKKLNRTCAACVERASKLGLVYTEITDKITASEAAEILGTSQNTVYDLIKKGKLKAYRKCIYKGKFIFLKLEEVEKFAETYKKYNPKSWTETEYSKLEMYLKKGLTSQQIAEKMGRTKYSIEHKVARIFQA